MNARVDWFGALSTFCLERLPVICVVGVGGYMAANSFQQSVLFPPTVPAPPSVSLSGEEVTAMVQDAHLAALAAAKARTKSEAVQTVAAEPKVETPQKARAAAPPAKAARHQASSQPLPGASTPAPLPPPTTAASTVEVEQQPSWYGRTWGTVTRWSGTVVRTTRLDDAADLAIAAPGAVVRVGKRAVGAVADTILPGARD